MSTELRRAAEALLPSVAALWPGLSVEVVQACSSTNSELLERARQGLTAPALLVAGQQTAGRGRQGRAWLSEPGAALLMSLAVPLQPADGEAWPALSLVVGAALAEALEPAGRRIALKWPNDLWLREGAPGQGRKLAGILIETVNVGEQRVAVIGIGINVKPLPQAAVQAYRSGHAALQELLADATPASALMRVFEPLAAALRRFEHEGLAPFAAAWAARDLLAGIEVVASGTTAIVGVAEGIDTMGRLRLRDAAGTLHAIHSGEVSVRPATGGLA